MANRKISELSEIITVENNIDVLPIVDISANTTKKITPIALKFALQLNNVDNTSDGNKPVSLAQQDALDSKIDKNSLITAGSAPKITFDSKGLVTSGDPLDEVDLPTGINANKIATGIVSNAEFEYLNGVTGNIQTAIDAKQDTLVSGTNIKTINSTSLLGSGDVAVQQTLVSGTNIKTLNSESLLGSGNIEITASPAGVAGAIQFSDGSAFASDASNLFWDDTNNRLGVGTNAPSATTHIKGSGTTLATTALLVQNSAGTELLKVVDGGSQKIVTIPSALIGTLSYFGSIVESTSTQTFKANGVAINGDYSSPAASTRLHVKGSGTTSATTSLLVQNSAGAETFKVQDNGVVAIENFTFVSGSVIENTTTRLVATTGGVAVNSNYAFANSSSILDVASTTKGFLPPRMTTTQKNAISSPAAGLVVYDTTLNKLCVYTTAWETITST
jgi:hypothetical protein